MKTYWVIGVWTEYVMIKEDNQDGVTHEIDDVIYYKLV